MSIFNLEYTLCLLQRDKFSFAAKSHRRENGDPKIEINVFPSYVEWILTNLDQGIPETIAGIPRVDRVDFYFLRDYLQKTLQAFPTVNIPRNSGLIYPATNSAGTERTEGKRVRILYPICRFFPIEELRLIVNKQPEFGAISKNAYLHLDIETGPKKIYGEEIFEIHLGFETSYEVFPLTKTQDSKVFVKMSREMYSTIISELRKAIR